MANQLKKEDRRHRHFMGLCIEKMQFPKLESFLERSYQENTLSIQALTTYLNEVKQEVTQEDSDGTPSTSDANGDRATTNDANGATANDANGDRATKVHDHDDGAQPTTNYYYISNYNSVVYKNCVVRPTYNKAPPHQLRMRRKRVAFWRSSSAAAVGDGGGSIAQQP